MSEPKVHYVISSEVGYTVCGRYVSLTVQVTREPPEATCAQCLRELSDPDRQRGLNR
jgi:hypothetical protein